MEQPPIEGSSMQTAIAVVEIEAKWLLGGVLNEMQEREHISDEAYERQWDEKYAAVMARLEQQCCSHSTIE